MEIAHSSTLPGAEAEARHATIIKCDLVGSTRARKSLDLEGQLDFQRRFEETVVEVADRHGAHIAGFEGDGALIAFGLPAPREDDAELAIRMALDLIDAVGAAELMPNRRSQVRIGVASGLIAVVKRPMTARGEYFAGTTIDLAERLRAQADPDQLIVADETKRLAGGYFLYEDLGEVVCKGFDEPVRAWRVGGRASPVSRFEAQRFDPTRSEIVGRDDALILLADAWVAAQQGRGRGMCLRGDAGIGKSRLARAAIDRAIQDNAALLRIDCAPSAVNSPLFPIGLVLHEAAGVSVQATPEQKRVAVEELLRTRLPAEEAAGAMTYLGPLFGLNEASVSADGGPDAFRERTIATLVQIFDSLSAERPLLLVCEDLHWASDSTASLIARLCSVVEAHSALVLVTARPSADLSAFGPSLTIIDLRPFDDRVSADLVRSVAKGAPLADDIIRRIVDRCEGLPLIIEEVTRNTLEASLRADDLAPAASRTRDVPTALQIIVQSRLNRQARLAPLAQSAAVLGRVFPRDLLQRILPEGWAEEVPGAIDLLTREGLFAPASEAAPERIQFRHGMICDAVYNTMLGRDRRRLHSAAADILARNYAGTPYATPDIVARHLSGAGRFLEAIRMRLIESASTASRGAYVETEGHCEAALLLIDEVADPQQRAPLQFRLLVQLGVARTGRHGFSAATVEEAYRRAYAACGDTADAETLYPVTRGLAGFNLLRGKFEKAQELAEQGQELAEKSRRPEFRLDALSMLAYTAFYQARTSDSARFIEQCLNLYRAADGERLSYPSPQDAATSVFAIQPSVLWLLGDAEGSERSMREGVRHVEKLDRDYDRAMVHAFISSAHYLKRHFMQAVEHGATALRLAEAHGYTEWRGISAILTLTAQAASAPNPQAVAQAEAICAEFLRQGIPANAPFFFMGIARGYATMGDAAAAQKAIAQGLEVGQATGETRMVGELETLQAELEPRHEEAATLLRSALAHAEQREAIATALRATALLALRVKPDDAARASAEAALAALDGLAPLPAESDWMSRRLAALKDRLSVSPRPTAPAA